MTSYTDDIGSVVEIYLKVDFRFQRCNSCFVVFLVKLESRFTCLHLRVVPFSCLPRFWVRPRMQR